MTMRNFLLIPLFLSFWSALALGAEPLTTQQMNLYFVNQEVLYERGNSQDLRDRRPLNFGIDYHWNRVSLLAEFSRFTESTGNSTSSIERNHQDTSAWLRYHFLKQKNYSLKSSLFAGMGMGVYEEELKTQLLGVMRTDKSSPQNFTGIVLGAGITAPLQNQFILSMLCEVRATSAMNNDPNPIWSGVVRFGLGRAF